MLVPDLLVIGGHRIQIAPGNSQDQVVRAEQCHLNNPAKQLSPVRKEIGSTGHDLLGSIGPCEPFLVLVVHEQLVLEVIIVLSRRIAS